MTDREQRIREILLTSCGSRKARLKAVQSDIGSPPRALVGSEPEEEARVEGERPAELKKEPSSIAAAGSD